MENNESKISRFKLFIKKKITTLLQGKKCLISTGIIIGGLTLTYVIGGLYFMDHFYWGTTLNGIDVGGRSLEYATVKLGEQSSDYTLELQERHGKEEILKGSEIGLVYEVGDNIKQAKVSQNAWEWPRHIAGGEKLEVDKA